MEDIIGSLNPQQKKIVEYGDGPMLILAGAGAGKTRVLTHRIAYLISVKGINPESILAVTFTNKAASEMKIRVQKIFSVKHKPFISTFHRFCAYVLRNDGDKAGVPRDFLIYDDSDQKKVIKNILDKIGLTNTKFKPSSLLISISQIKNEFLTIEEYARIARGYWQETVLKVYPEYQKELNRIGAVDFDDLLLKTVELFQKDKKALEKYQERFRYILVDEYQDTNGLQYLLTKLLAKKYRNISVVGDCSQSIYSWRGADFRNVLKFQETFQDAKIFNLEQNYRSTQVILDAAHSVIKNNNSHPILKLWTDKDLGEKIKIYGAQTGQDEADFIVSTLLQLHRQQSEIKASDIAVLYRTNTQSRIIEEVFLHYGIPYVLIGGVRFYERKEIKDVLSYLRLALNPKDLVALERAFSTGKRRTEKLLEFIKKTNNLSETLSTIEIMDKILEITDYLALFNKEEEEDAARLENIKELRSVATEYSKLLSFLENVALVEKEISSIGSKNELIRQGKKEAITLMTLHQAKGLEFDTVFLVGMEEGLFPHSKSLADNYELEEERRLCYVGITRAKKRLFLSYAKRRLFFGSWVSNTTSRFLAELPSGNLEFLRTKFDVI